MIGQRIVAAEEHEFGVGIDGANLRDDARDLLQDFLRVCVAISNRSRARFRILKDVVRADRKNDCVGVADVVANRVIVKAAFDIGRRRSGDSVIFHIERDAALFEFVFEIARDSFS